MPDSPELATKAAQGEEDWNPTHTGACLCIWPCVIGFLTFCGLLGWGVICLVQWLAK